MLFSKLLFFNKSLPRLPPSYFLKMASDESSETGSGYSSSEEEEEENDGEEEEEPILKYRRFAKEVVNSLSQSGAAEGEPKNVIICMAVHPKVIQLP